MSDLNASVQFFSYGLATAVFLLFALLLLFSSRGKPGGVLLTITILISACWAFLMAWGATPPGLTTLQLLIVEFVHDAAWLVLLSSLLSGAIGSERLWIVRYGGYVLPAIALAAGIALEIQTANDPLSHGSGSVLVFGSLLTSLFALVAVEQLYRNARELQRRELKYLCLGVGGIFVYDLFLYSNAILVGHVSDLFWAVRGAVVAMCVPLIGVAVQRSRNWSSGIFVSRHIVFYTATIFGAGVYLTLIGITGYYLRHFGSNWGPAAQTIVFAAGSIGLFVFLFSGVLRARLKVFISKHFFENRYDYREEWLRLIETLTSPEESLPLKKRAIRALAQIVESPDGLLWMAARESDDYSCVAGWNRSTPDEVIERSASLPQFLVRAGWVIEMREFRTDPDRYESLDFDGCIPGMQSLEFVIPLLHDARLLGFVVLSSPVNVRPLNYEDRDLLKTAGQQIASYLAQELATEQLAEHRQFEAFNRLTAFLMHDLKNVVAQQSLVVENAQRHKSNPEFVDDVIGTVKNSVSRLQRVIQHLRQGASDQPLQKAELGKLVMQAVSQCADRQPVPRALIGETQLWVNADKDRLLMAIQHAIRNAQDATAVATDGSVTVELQADADCCTVSVTDNGGGMDDAFIRDRLFKPFDSTKGSQGMGIGAYQLRETIRQLGGWVTVDSEPEQGTTIGLTLNLVTPG